MELVKPIIKVGNSAGVILPKEWLNGEAKVTLFKQPIKIKENVLNILSRHLPDILGIALVGSYARNEQNSESDVDILAITNKNLNLNKIISGKYEILLISKSELEEALKDNALPILPMLKEAKPIINSSIFWNYKSYNLTEKNLKMHFNTTKTALKVIKSTIELAKEKNENISSNIAYSLVLRLRQCYIVGSLLTKKTPTNKEFLKLVRKLTNSLDIYKAYMLSKVNPRARRATSIKDAELVYNYIKEMIAYQEKWTKRKY